MISADEEFIVELSSISAATPLSAGRRCAGTFVDWLVLQLVFIFVLLPLVDQKYTTAFLISVVIALSYFIAPSILWSTTPGKMLFRTHFASRSSGLRLSQARYVVRSISSCAAILTVNTVPLFAGKVALVAALAFGIFRGDRHQSVLDRVVDSIVVADATSQRVTDAP